MTEKMTDRLQNNMTGKKIFLDLIIVLIWTIAAFIFTTTYANIVQTHDNNFVRVVIGIILGVPTVLFIPGYVLIMTLFPNRDALSSTERIALSFGMSMVIIPILGLLLSFTLGTGMPSVTLALCAYIIIMIFVAMYRRGRLPEKEKFSISIGKLYKDTISGIFPRSTIDGILTGIIIFTIILVFGMAYLIVVTPKIGERFTEFYILDPSGKIDNYQTDWKVGNPVSYSVFVTNHEYMPMNYTINAVIGENVITSVDAQLEDGATWKSSIIVTPDREGIDERLQFLLFKENNQKEPYRKLYLWINSTI